MCGATTATTNEAEQSEMPSRTSGAGRGHHKRRGKYRPPKSVGTLTWERWPNEPKRLYYFFNLYLLMGVDRTIRRCAEEIDRTEKYLGKPASKWWWIERACDYDLHEIERTRRAQETAAVAAVRKMRKRHIKIAEELQDAAELELTKLLNEIRGSGKKRKVTPDQLLKIIDAGTKLERLTRGEPGEVTEARLTKAPGLSDDAADSIREVLGVPGDDV